jgi:hypothetical protein
MACTLSNRETFVVMCWLDEDPDRMARLRDESHRLLRKGFEEALPRMSDYIYDELRRTLPPADGLVGALLGSGLSRVNFLELAHAMLMEATSARKAEAHAAG